MQTTLCWTGEDYHSSEKCRLHSTDAGNEVNGVIDGHLENGPFHLEYLIKTNQHWQTIAFEIKSTIAGKPFNLHFESNGMGAWTTDGRPADEFTGCIDIDISLTPFTNTLPVNRLHLAKKRKTENYCFIH